MKRALVLACGLLVLPVAAAYAQLPVELARDQQALVASKDPALAANKRLVYDYWREVLQTHDTSRAAHYMAADFIEHNPVVPTGLKGFTGFLGKLERRALKPTVDNLVSIVAEGNLVVLAFREELKDPKKPGSKYTTTWFDMFRVSNGKIVEHWDYGTK
ncbi:MAG: nuclear transport factor 2 family protein [Gemmatimonadaceae bacterium]|nr:nuclear transport factor 2 family protein [Gemmatimonadaceae bacterium]